MTMAMVLITAIAAAEVAAATGKGGAIMIGSDHGPIGYLDVMAVMRRR